MRPGMSLPATDLQCTGRSGFQDLDSRLIQPALIPMVKDSALTRRSANRSFGKQTCKLPKNAKWLIPG